MDWLRGGRNDYAAGVGANRHREEQRMSWSWDREDLSLAVRFLRALRGWNQTELARAMGWDKSRISLLESGKQEPEKADLQQLAKAIGLPFFLLEACLPLLRLLRGALGRTDLSPEMGERVAVVADAVSDRVAAATRITVTTALLEVELLAEAKALPTPLSCLGERSRG
ncbi:MAG TPA: helix-turn-helix transcriptional regulator [Thermoanaerobaculia bacterium]|nr:helix-turn-helix transcriptional regulator [Thermoanaerobaculia bacterium]